MKSRIINILLTALLLDCCNANTTINSAKTIDCSEVLSNGPSRPLEDMIDDLTQVLPLFDITFYVSIT